MSRREYDLPMVGERLFLIAGAVVGLVAGVLHPAGLAWWGHGVPLATQNYIVVHGPWIEHVSESVAFGVTSLASGMLVQGSPMPVKSPLGGELPGWSLRYVYTPFPYRSDFGPPECRRVTLEVAMGWPARSLATEWFSDDTTEHSVRLRSRDLVVIMYNNDGSLARRTMPDGSGLLPTRIIWSGMIINTLAWSLAGAAFGWCSWAVPARVLGRSRRKRGLCPRCAHPVSGSRCTECGGSTPSVGAAWSR
jgi:hypothetical protein